jgi:hypothetical protein
MMRPTLRLSSIVALTACFAACSFGCSGGTDNNVDPGTIDTGVDGEPDSSSGDLGVDTTPVDSGGGEDTADSSIPDSGSDTEMSADTADSAPMDTEMPDTADSAPPDTEMPDTMDSAPPDTEGPDTRDTAPVCTVGGTCNDGNACTTGETFDSTCTCTGGTAIVCNDSNVCTTDTCNTSSGCVYTATGEGTSCGSGKKCTSGICTDLCTEGATCNDGNACTTGEKFTSTCACAGGTTIGCDDSNPCTTDSCNTSTGCVNAPLGEGTACGTGKICSSGTCVDASTVLPTVTISAPADLIKKSFKATGPGADVCNALPFTITVNAPKGISTLTWHFFTPTTNSGMNGDVCGAPTSALPPWRAGLGTPIYGHMIDPTKYSSMTSGTFTENVAVSGLYMGGLWLWCTEPGTSGTAFLTSLSGSAIPAPNGGITPLSRYCHSTTLPADTDTAKQWTLIVQLTDKVGVKVTDETKFWIYKE